MATTTTAEGLRRLSEALSNARNVISDTRFPLTSPTADEAKLTATELVNQLDGYVLPRLRRLDAPLLAVVAGSSGAGKSTLVNSIVGALVSPAGVLRPTTRSPVLACHPDDDAWFLEPRLLPGLTRSGTPTNDPEELRVVAAPSVTRGAALLDAPDIDSVVHANGRLAARLLGASEVWLFVTTAARYGDALPLSLLERAHARGTALALVLNRVPPGADAEIVEHLAAITTDRGLPDLPLFVVPESRLDDDGALPSEATLPLRTWFAGLAASEPTRRAAVLRAVGGAIDLIESATTGLAAAADEQVRAAWSLTSSVRSAERAAQSLIDRGVADGAPLRGEALARWEDLVASDAVTRPLRGRIGRLGDRVAATVARKPRGEELFVSALESAIVALVRGAVADAGEQCASAWRANPAGAGPLSELTAAGPTRLAGDGPVAEGADGSSDFGDLHARTRRLVRDWRRGLGDTIRSEPSRTRQSDDENRSMAEAALPLVMALVFEEGGAGVAGVTAPARAVLHEVFEEAGLKGLVAHGREDLLSRARSLIVSECSRYRDVVDGSRVDETAGDRLRHAANEIMIARLRAGLPAARSAPSPLTPSESPPTTGADGSPKPLNDGEECPIDSVEPRKEATAGS